MFNMTSKYFSVFNNTQSASWVAHISRDFLTCYSCSYYCSNVTIILVLLSYLPSKQFRGRFFIFSFWEVYSACKLQKQSGILVTRKLSFNICPLRWLKGAAQEFIKKLFETSTIQHVYSGCLKCVLEDFHGEEVLYKC